MACKGCGDKRIADAYFCNKCLIEKKKFLWCVITSISDNELDNRYDDIINVNHKQIKEYAQFHGMKIKEVLEEFNLKKYTKPTLHYSSHVKPQAFTLGEIFPIDPNFERELVGDRRKPCRWNVEYETFPATSYQKAILRAVEVQDEYMEKRCSNQK